MQAPDINRTSQVSLLLQVPPELRDSAWADAFFEAVTHASFAAGEPRLVQGPDGYPYYVLRTPEPFHLFDAHSIAFLAEEVTRRGFGIVLNPGPGTADWVFSYGDIAALRMTGSLRPQLPPPPPETEGAEEREDVVIGPPSEEALPGYVRRTIHEHLRRIGLEDPGVLLMHRPTVSETHLVFNVFPELFASEDDFRMALGSVSWFLPRHYTIVGVSRDTFAPEAFHSLAAPLAPSKPGGAKPAAEREGAAKPEKKPAKKKPWYRRIL